MLWSVSLCFGTENEKDVFQEGGELQQSLQHACPRALCKSWKSWLCQVLSCFCFSFKIMIIDY